jgi:hypothetical protein
VAPLRPSLGLWEVEVASGAKNRLTARELGLNPQPIAGGLVYGRNRVHPIL